MADWKKFVQHDPVEPLVSSNYVAIQYFSRRDLLCEDVESIEKPWNLKKPKKLLGRQLEDGSWKYPGKNPARYPDVNYGLVETFKHLRLLVGKYGFDGSHPVIDRAVEYMFSCQTGEGDIRGAYASQYHPHYCGAFMEFIIKAGYSEDSRVEKCIRWLLSVQGDDGGWSPPMLTEGLNWKDVTELSTNNAPTLGFDRSKPSCNMVTGMTLRALACHPEYRISDEARKAGEFLSTRFFKANIYNTYKAEDNWVRFQYPYWWNNLLGALDSLSRIGFTVEHPKVKEALDWFIEHQRIDGLWDGNYKKNAKKIDTEKAREERHWISLAVCRMMKKFYEN